MRIALAKECLLVLSFTATSVTSFHLPLKKKLISLRYAGSLNRHQLYMVIVANAYGCTQGPFWLSGRTVLKIKGHDSLSTTEVSFLPLFAYAYVVDLQRLQNTNTALKFGIIVGVETSRYLTKMTILWRKAARSKVLAAKHTASLQLLCTVGGNQARLGARTVAV